MSGGRRTAGSTFWDLITGVQKGAGFFDEEDQGQYMPETDQNNDKVKTGPPTLDARGRLIT